MLLDGGGAFGFTEDNSSINILTIQWLVVFNHILCPADPLAR